jgi:hypothetical protein
VIDALSSFIAGVDRRILQIVPAIRSIIPIVHGNPDFRAIPGNRVDYELPVDEFQSFSHADKSKALWIRGRFEADSQILDCHIERML